jgi:hypothetical protein
MILWRDLLVRVVAELHDRGVAVPSSSTSRGIEPICLLVGQLLLLDVDWTQPAAELVDRLNVLGRGGYSADGLDVRMALGADARSSRLLADMARELRGTAVTASRRPGQTRRAKILVAERRKIVRYLRKLSPDVTVKQLRLRWNDPDHHQPGRQLRDLLPTGTRCPAASTLYEDFIWLDDHPDDAPDG